jgi:hypothetical protein
VVVAVLAVRAVEVISNQVVGVTVVWHRLVSTSGSVLVLLVVFAAGVLRGAPGGIPVGGLDGALVDVALVAVMQVTVVQVVDMAGVLDGAMSAAGPVRVTMPLVLRVVHCASPFLFQIRRNASMRP